MVWQKHMRRRNPIQLKRKAVRKAVKKMKSLPSRAVSAGESRVDEAWEYQLILVTQNLGWSLRLSLAMILTISQLISAHVEHLYSLPGFIDDA